MSKHLTAEDLAQIARAAEFHANYSGPEYYLTSMVTIDTRELAAVCQAFLQLYTEKLSRDSEVNRVWGAVG